MTTFFTSETKQLPKANIVGGKALNLIELNQKGFQVPQLVVLSNHFFLPFIQEIKKSEEWQSFIKNKNTNIKKATNDLFKRASKLQLNKKSRKELHKALEFFSSSSNLQKFAVRSSSPNEDLDNASFAGGFESFLDIDLKSIESTVIKCFASYFDERVFIYKKNKNLDPSDIKFAVIIQKQIYSDKSGVGFSINPINNSYNEIIINSNYGQGETVVSGSTHPDEIIVDKHTQEILKTIKGSKEDIKFLKNKKISNLKKGTLSLNNLEIKNLVQLIKSVEDFYNEPIDIEWAIEDTKLYLLQARPITTYHPLPKEMITNPGENKFLYANSTLIEQGLQEPISVLGTDFMNYILRAASGDLKGNKSVGIEGITFATGGQYYMNLSNIMTFTNVKNGLAPGSSDDKTVHEILDSINLDDYNKHKSNIRLFKIQMSSLSNIFNIVLETIKLRKNPKKYIEKYNKSIDKQFLSFLEKDKRFSFEDIYSYLDFLTYELSFFLSPKLSAPVINAEYSRKKITKLFDIENTSNKVLSDINISLPHNKTTEMGHLIYKINTKEEFKNYSNAHNFLKDLNSQKLSNDLTILWNEFLENYSIRGPKEIDVAWPRISEDKMEVFNYLKSINIDSSDKFEDNNKKREKAYNYLKTKSKKISKKAYKTFKNEYEIIYNCGGLRESGKHYIVHTVYMFRKRMMSLAEKLVKSGDIDNVEHIFDLKISQINQKITGQDIDLRSCRKENLIYYKKLKQSHFTPRIIDPRGKIFLPKVKKDGNKLIGIPISSGKFKGRVRVLENPDQKKLTKEDILVVKATNPGWTPLFINLGGLIMEIGGSLQHGAVIAREYGVPCVSGVVDATKILKDGQTVIVDGSNGTVEILKDN